MHIFGPIILNMYILPQSYRAENRDNVHIFNILRSSKWDKVLPNKIRWVISHSKKV